MAQVAAGNESAFEVLVCRHASGVSRYLRSMVKDAERALDLTQETFLKVWLKADRFKPTAPFRAWLYKLARNTAISDLRKARVREVLNLSWPTRDSGEFDPAWSGRGPEEATLATEVRQLVGEQLQRLPQKLRETFVLADVEGLSMTELARVTGSPEGTVKARLHRARRALRQALDTKLDGRSVPLEEVPANVRPRPQRVEEM
jgi:RNA polymerase sigma-70 factor (ECF subfamily)